MEKNNFLIYNDIVYTLYQCKSYEALRDEFLPRLRLLIPFTYASIISVNPENRTEIVPTPVCFPDYFYEAELLYIDHMSEDHLLWIYLCTYPAYLQRFRESNICGITERF